MKAIDTREARQRLEALIEEMGRRPRPIRIVRKGACWHQRWAAAGLRVVTFGGQRTYLTHYVTTLGRTIYVPDDFEGWSPTRAWQILRHELVHVAQFERYGWVLMVLLYGVLPLPLGLSWFRARFEMEAYAETLRAVAESEGMEAARSPQLREEIVRRFTGPDYAWMWPFPGVVRGWIAEALAQIERGGADRAR
ncbi:hypothetical protein [Chondromyces apiculatus]|uniref:DUF4157 domain-containing protein n=1 Tax=Chondromyces apiculatus DSM 436 TaxID=1192034 RepID=A0A017SVR1_9BACT|nr:hypothetical protein [Chondromyces apiculatus]EYF01029.1 Hypothetical protein CAP_8816 [Chondromyces apiculatus DSM 436]